jgi:hypothetical protein
MEASESLEVTQHSTPSSLLEVRQELLDQQRLELLVAEPCRPMLVDLLARAALLEGRECLETQLRPRNMEELVVLAVAE